MRARPLRSSSRLNRIWRSEVSSPKTRGSQRCISRGRTCDLLANRVHGISAERLQFRPRRKNTSQASARTRPRRSEESDALIVDIESDPLRDLHYLLCALTYGAESESARFSRRTNQRNRWRETSLLFMQTRPGISLIIMAGTNRMSGKWRNGTARRKDSPTSL